MAAVPFLHAYLFYCLGNEAKVRWRASSYNSTLYSVMMAVPFLWAYPAYKLYSIVDDGMRSEGKPGYPAKPWVIAALLVLPPLAPFAWLYSVYATQAMFNENGILPLARAQ